MRKLLLVTTAAIGLIAASSAFAAPITLDFDGVITSNSGPSGMSYGSPVGSAYSGTITYDTAAVPSGVFSLPGFLSQASYQITNLSFQFQGTTVTYTGNAFIVGVTDGAPGTGIADVINIQTGQAIATGGGQVFFGLNFTDSSGNAINHSQPIFTDIAVADFPVHSIVVSGPGGTIGGTVTYVGAITVPEPVSIAVLGVGLLGLGFVRQKQARAA